MQISLQVSRQWRDSVAVLSCLVSTKLRPVAADDFQPLAADLADFVQKVEAAHLPRVSLARSVASSVSAGPSDFGLAASQVWAAPSFCHAARWIGRSLVKQRARSGSHLEPVQLKSLDFWADRQVKFHCLRGTPLHGPHEDKKVRTKFCDAERMLRDAAYHTL